MARGSLTTRIENELERDGIYVAVEEDGDVIRLTGRVPSDDDRQAALDVAARLAPEKRIDDNIDLEMTLPQQVGGLTSGQPSPSDLPDDLADVEALGATIEPDFTDQSLLSDNEVVGPDSWGPDDPAEEGAHPYTPPIDPVTTTNPHGEAEVIGGTEIDSMESVQVAPSAQDALLGDEAIADAIGRELLEDASTTDLHVRVVVDHGIVRLSGRVPMMVDAENAQAVAARVPGVREVIDELEVEGI